MILQFVAQYSTGRIRYTQTSFLELETATEVHRIDLVGKYSWGLKRGTGGQLAYHTEHPLLWGFNAPHTSLYMNARPMQADVGALLVELKQELNGLAGEWQDRVRGSWHPWWRRIVAHNLAGGQGLLLDTVPVFAADAAARVCARHGVATYLFPQVSGRLAPRPEPYVLLLVGTNYVVAQDFVVSTLCGAWAK
ncbi:hypothetical protein LRS06_11400 [Hymenobacter sp. J193]|uniref:hypothetical protein n=1 Tax=Hymenobacter sp. J193 TaxID=2898429 RepID=UPI002151EA22|nr:hypothetical protein [Hymenobacter sp. J193]MCR5888358.1 hypothetical protein [Hymenobacter sp. J193]